MNCTKIILLVLAICCFSTTIQAQEKVSKEYRQELSEAMNTLEAKQQKNVLIEALRLADVDADKEMKRLLKKISAENRKKVLLYTQNYKALNEKAKAKAKAKPQAQPKPKTKTNVVKAKPKPQPKQNVAKPQPKPNDKVAAQPKAQPKPQVKPAAPKPTLPKTTIEFMEKEFDFGVVQSGEKVSYVYKFKNTGKEPLVISNARGSCGCTVPSWPKEAIAAGESGEIKVVFNTRGKSGRQAKRVTITANTQPAQTFITIKGQVNKPQPNK